jgi:hypothetical protein
MSNAAEVLMSHGREKHNTGDVAGYDTVSSRR